MRYVEFEQLWKKMCKVFNRTESLTDKDVIDIYFREVKTYNNDYNVLEQRILQKYKYFPKPADLLETISEVKNELAKVKDKNKVFKQCDMCNGSGFVIIKDEKQREYAVACDCENGDDKLYDGRTITDKRYRSPYVIKRYSEMFAKEN